MTSLVALILAAVADPTPAPAYPWGELVLALFMVLLTVGLIVAEVFLASMGLLALAAAGCGITAIVLAFGISTATGWGFLVVVPIIVALVVRWGLAHLQSSRLVPKAEITTDAGYHQLTDRLGVTAGTLGELVTDAIPTGRARFTNAKGTDDLDVTVAGRAGRKGDKVRVLRIEGPQVMVVIENTPA
jgi:membrane-bound ClpP family serine protease